ncbi:MAG TPA: S53 family peptidase, partial [Patescibacteria group bacterium]|nr:S53 family peptidase [Patescibacteria group bacterium]
IACGFNNTPLQNVLLSGATGIPSTNSGNVSEVSMDIEVVLAMATNLSRLYVFEAPLISSASVITMLNAMATSNQISQFSSSWSGGQSATADQIFQTMAAQGQSFFVASGDGDAYTYPVPWPNDNPYITSVGGTTLNMNTNGPTYISETVWNSGFLGTNNTWFGNGQSGWWGSGGGSTSTYDMPGWQQSVDFASLGGSTTKRNVPDVAMVANQGWIIWFNGLSGPAFGTSMAAPLWAGFTALVNQQAALSGNPPVGFLNPALYSIGKGRSYALVFHDITNGNNTWSGSTNQFYAVPGFDLCTGWGTPTAGLVSVLANFANSVWVDFTIPGPGSGTFDDPFNTLVAGVNAVGQGGTIMLKTPGTSPERLTITKPLKINTDGGSATIGQ